MPFHLEAQPRQEVAVPKVRFLNELVTVEVPEGSVLRDVAIDSGVEVYRGMWGHLNCGGNGICGRCRIWLVQSARAASTPSLRERMHRVRGSQRLACQVRVLGDLDIRSRPIGPSVVERRAEAVPPSYLEAAAARYREAKEEEARAAAAPKKADRPKPDKPKPASPAPAVEKSEAAGKTESPPAPARAADVSPAPDAAPPAASAPAKTDPEKAPQPEQKPAGETGA